ncbi:methylamine utilization protein [Alteromonas oceanisediminis]|uniref:methylamine utilization protein n=1 Tax=Alteromonas oceanisediminis TaxID=2836180 RepID=UPI001BDAF24C|nr:methylamine utilization protein [Alteromonas oceanisediminis]MBT0586601.1 methylamine utilization protein [Alteromonas oceanisediminis]
MMKIVLRQKCGLFATLIIGLNILSAQALAQNTITLYDQHGAPVPDAVISIPRTSSSTTETQPVAVMDQVNMQFSPQVLVIDKGQSVMFPNSDDIRHHVYSFSQIKPFEIKLYKGSEVPPVAFDQPGIAVLGCNIHDNMIAHIYVADNETAAATNTLGQVQFEQDVPLTVTVWHPKLSLSATERRQIELIPVDGEYHALVNLLQPAKKTETRTFGSRTFGKKN